MAQLCSTLCRIRQDAHNKSHHVNRPLYNQNQITTDAKGSVNYSEFETVDHFNNVVQNNNSSYFSYKQKTTSID